MLTHLFVAFLFLLIEKLGFFPGKKKKKQFNIAINYWGMYLMSWILENENKRFPLVWLMDNKCNTSFDGPKKDSPKFKIHGLKYLQLLKMNNSKMDLQPLQKIQRLGSFTHDKQYANFSLLQSLQPSNLETG